MYRGIVSSLRKKEIVYHKKKRKSTTSIASSSTSSKKGTSNRQSTTSLVKLGSNKTLQIINLPFKDHLNQRMIAIFLQITFHIRQKIFWVISQMLYMINLRSHTRNF